jgi:hypothetical protein
MNAKRMTRLSSTLTGFLLGLVIAAPSWAAFGAPPAQVIKGTVQSIDYLHHAITVNGQTYAVASNARFSGVAGFSVLHIGMPIAYTLGSAAQTPGPGGMPHNADGPAAQTEATGAAVIISITWLPGGV